MVIELKEGFMEALSKCPEDFKLQFRKVYQQLKVVDHPLEIKRITTVKGHSKMFKLFIDESRISINWDGKVLIIHCFLFNQFLQNSDRN